MSPRVRSSVNDVAAGLEAMLPRDQERALANVIPGPRRCISSTYTALTTGGPQIGWEGADGVQYQMYHWRVYMYLTEGRIPALYSSRRQCVNRRCVNPDHRS